MRRLSFALLIVMINSLNLYGQSLEVIYEMSSYNGLITDELRLITNENESQFIYKIKAKNIDYEGMNLLRGKRKFITNYSNNNTEFTEYAYKNKNIYSASWTNDEYTWSITDDTETILDYKVIKAYLDDKDMGKVYAWFAPDIPISSGPYRYTGLPGLILKLEYEDINTEFVVKSIHTADSVSIETINEPKAINISKAEMVKNDF